MDARSTRDEQYLSLRTGATLAYIGLVGRSPYARDTVAMHRVLDDVAHALAILAPIQILHDGATLEPLDSRFLMAGRFVRGGSALVAPDGKEHKELVIQRADLTAAIAILLQTGLAKSLREAQGEV